MFSFENHSDIEAASNASEFLRDTPNIWDIDHALVHLCEEGQLLLDDFIMESMNSFEYSLSIRSCLMSLIPSLKSL
jgi:hypothetical protein